MRLWKLKESLAAITIGDRTVGHIVPREHLLRPTVPQGTYKVARFFADSATYLRLLGPAQIGFGVCLALRQYREE